MHLAPLKFQQTLDGLFLFSDDTGGFFKASREFLHRYVTGSLTAADTKFLLDNCHAFSSLDSLEFDSFQHKYAARLHVPGDLKYVILVPTLRCDLACSYCQVSRVNQSALGFDWSWDTLAGVLKFLDGLPTKELKVEFQGGEPTLRLDLIQQVVDFCRKRFDKSEFVICTNLQNVSSDAWQLFQQPDVFVSTSLDADRATHEVQRTADTAKTSQFFQNMTLALKELGPGKVSALPTIDPFNPPEPEDLIRTYASYDMRSIYLRPVNHQGFARKRFAARDSSAAWSSYYRRFMEALIVHNMTADEPVEEFYFTHCLRRILRSGHNSHVDLRNPNIIGHDYLVVDYDGTFYPTDEARMLTRVGQFDLSMGNVINGLSRHVVNQLNAEASNSFHPDCMHCVYQPFCGTDTVDDLSRYGRIDLPKHQTNFCQRHMSLFNLMFEFLYSGRPEVMKSMAIWAGTPNVDSFIVKVHQ